MKLTDNNSVTIWFDDEDANFYHLSHSERLAILYDGAERLASIGIDLPIPYKLRLNPTKWITVNRLTTSQIALVMLAFPLENITIEVFFDGNISVYYDCSENEIIIFNNPSRREMWKGTHNEILSTEWAEYA